MMNQQENGAAERKSVASLVAADGTRYELSGDKILGRSDNDDITIPESNISRGHARFRLAGDQLTLEDLGSTNGTRVNRERIEDVAVLSDGDIVTFDTIDFRIQLSGAAQGAGKATAGADDATVVGAAVPGPETPQAGSAQVAGAWAEPDGGTGTVVMYKDRKRDDANTPVMVEHSSDLTHLIIFTESESGAATILELETEAGDEQAVWEIGRDENCSIVVANDSVSARHAQLIYQDGRWRLVNLVSTNGIYINGEKRLTAFLADGDDIKLGTARLIFKLGSSSDQPGAASGGASGNFATPLMLGIGVAVVALALWWLVN